MTDPSVRHAVEAAGLSPHLVHDVVARALDEDLGAAGDVTTAATVPADLLGGADLVPRADGVVAGLSVIAWVFDAVSAGRVRTEFGTLDGARVTPGEVLATVRGPVRDLLTAERTALNLLTHLSGIATLTRRWVDAVEGTGAVVRDTRKTLPGLRALEKYAVRCGGGANHRMSLSDAVLVKDNHVAAAGSVAEAFAAVRAAHPELTIEIEVDTVAQAREVIDAGAQLVLLDNMSADQMREVVAYVRGRAGPSRGSAPGGGVELEASGRPTSGGVELEASGGLTLSRARAVAETGVDYLAVGALTHSAPALDIGLDIDPVPDRASIPRLTRGILAQSEEGAS